MRVLWAGVDGDPETMTHRGIEFERGVAVDVPDDHPFADDFRDNPVFSSDGADDDGLTGFTVAELKAHAASEGVDLGEATKKADIVAAIRAAKA